MNTAEQIGETNLRVIEQMGDAFNRKDLDTIISFFAEDGVYEDYTRCAPAGNRYVGSDAIRGIFEEQMNSFPGYYFENSIPVVSGNRGALEYTGLIPGEPEQRMQLCDFFEFEGGKVTRKSTWMKMIQ